MHHFTYRGGRLHAENVPIARIARSCPSPCYVYATATLARHYHVMRDAFAGRPVDIRFSVKCNSNVSVLATLARLGSGADVVSEGEIHACLRAGIPPERIVFSGIGKTEREISFALDTGIGQFNVESAPELEQIAAIAARKSCRAPVALRLNPDVRAGGHDKIVTGTKASKFGLPRSILEPLYRRTVADPCLSPQGLACHIGSQISDLAPLRDAFEQLATIGRELSRGGMPVPAMDLGGGLAVSYMQDADAPLPAHYAAMANDVFSDFEGRLIIEPGRVIAANAGILVATIIYVFERGERRFLVLDAAMNDLIRPTLYEAAHEVVLERKPAPDEPRYPFDIVGPVCEGGDTFALQRLLPLCKPGDRVAIMGSGAYGAVMASTYNSRPLIGEVLADGDRFCVVRDRQSIASMTTRDSIAPWLTPPSVPPARVRPGETTRPHAAGGADLSELEETAAPNPEPTEMP